MADATQTILTVSVPTLAVLIGTLVNNNRLSDTNRRVDGLRTDTNRRIDEFRTDMFGRFDAMERLFTEKLLRVEQVLDARLKHLEDRG